ncbi:hypothetical protein EDB89DRAFT_2012130, partial [Lactarius sanguifluus]
VLSTNTNAWPCTCALSLRLVSAAPHQARAAHRVSVTWVRPGGTDWWWQGRRGRWMGTVDRRNEYLRCRLWDEADAF